MKNTKKPLWWWIATWFGSGTSPVVSGTVGSLAALPFAYFIQINFGSWALFAAAIAMFLVGWWASNQFLLHNNKGDDPHEIVVDEVAGQWLLLSILFPSWQSYLVGFILFRIFDIIKPWPVSYADEKIKGGLGVMLDDMLAAFYPIVFYMCMIFAGYTLGMPEMVTPVISFLVGGYVP